MVRASHCSCRAALVAPSASLLTHEEAFNRCARVRKAGISGSSLTFAVSARNASLAAALGPLRDAAP